MVNSIAKGKRGERVITNFLTNLSGVKWFRVPCSGALWTAQKQERFKGDVYCKDELYMDFCIEVKNTKEKVLFHDVIMCKGFFGSWKQQLLDECGGDCNGLLFFKSGIYWCWLLHKSSNVLWHSSFINKLRSVSSSYHDFGVIDRDKFKELTTK